MKIRSAIAAATACILLVFGVCPESVYAQDTGTEALSDEVTALMSSQGLNAGNFSCSYYNTVTGESYDYNANKMMFAASLYKLPLNMYYYEQEAAGKISPNAHYGGYPLSTCHQYSLQYSDNGVSVAMMHAVGSSQQYKTLMLKYASMSKNDIGREYFSGNYSNSRYMMGVLKYLYSHADLFSRAIGYMDAANPGEYFEKYVAQYKVAQKYGWYEQNLNCAAIVYTQEPYLITAFTKDAKDKASILGQINKMFCDYNVSHYGGIHIGGSSLYNDVPENAWYFKSLAKATESKIFSGVGNNMFRPNDKLDVCQAVRIAASLNALLSGREIQTTAAGEKWYDPYFDYAESNNILDPNIFGDDNERDCTRAEFAYLICNAMPEALLPTVSENLPMPSDVEESSTYGQQIFTLYAAGIVTGCDREGNFKPERTVSRAEAAAMTGRALQLLQK